MNKKASVNWHGLKPSMNRPNMADRGWICVALFVSVVHVERGVVGRWNLTRRDQAVAGVKE